MTSKSSPVLMALTAIIAVGVAVAAVPSAPSQICVDNVCTTAPTTPAPSSAKGVKWHPGHYMLSNEVTRSASNETASKRSEQAIVLASGPNVVGWAGNYAWDILEPSQGKYDFSQIDGDIAALPGKKVIIQIVGDYDPSVHLPAYIRSNPAYGPSPYPGEYGYWTAVGGTWKIPAWWRPSVMSRWIALVQALGAYYDGNPKVEAIIDADDAEITLDSGSDFSVAGYRTQWQALGSAATAALPTTNFVQNQSFAEGGNIQDSANLLQDSYARRVAFGGPDILGNSLYTTDSSYISWGMRAYMGTAGTSPGIDYRGKMASIHNVQSPELIGQLGTYTPQDIFNWAEPNLHANYLLWNYLGGTGNGNWTGGANSVLSVINAHPLTHTACPTYYTAGCNTN